MARARGYGRRQSLSTARFALQDELAQRRAVRGRRTAIGKIRATQAKLGGLMARLLSRVGIDRLALGVVVVCCGAAAGAAPAGRTLMRYPTLHGGTIVSGAPGRLCALPPRA